MLEYVDRRNSTCYKWDSDHAKGLLPLWVADQDFKAAPAILQAMQRRLDHGVFGYSVVPDAYYEACANWFSRKHGWQGIARENCITTIGVVPAISATLAAMKQLKGTEQVFRVCTMTPVYNCFFSSIRNLGCELRETRLFNENNHYEIDWTDLEAAATESDMLLLCNPHNPTGRVWTRDELLRIADICHRHNLFVLSDEIHCEFTFPGVRYTPYATVALDDAYCVCTSASKAFNLAGLQCANIFVPNDTFRAAIDKAINVHEVCDLNPFGVVATIAAYNESEVWLNEVNARIYANYQLLQQALQGSCLSLTRMEGTYLAWVDVSACGLSSEQFCEALARQEGVLFNPSEMYGADGYVRINLATSSENVKVATDKLLHFVQSMNEDLF